MKYIIIILVANLVSLMCVAGSFYLVLNDIDGWGWFLFCGVITFVAIEYKKQKRD